MTTSPHHAALAGDSSRLEAIHSLRITVQAADKQNDIVLLTYLLLLFQLCRVEVPVVATNSVVP